MTANELKTPMPKPTPLQTLEDAIAMALSNGWTKGDLGLIFTLYSLPELLRHNRYYMIIFDHKFAQALWGEKLKQAYGFKDGTKISLSAWQYHLQQMVIAADPLKYLEENLPA